MEELRKYKIAALIGIIVMGIGAFMACLCTTSSLIMTGNVLLIASILAAVTETILSFDKFFPTKKETDLLFRTEDLFLFYLLFKKFFYGSGNTSV